MEEKLLNIWQSALSVLYILIELFISELMELLNERFSLHMLTFKDNQVYVKLKLLKLMRSTEKYV
jgi:hypothetical protein